MKKPSVYFDIVIGNQEAGRITFELNTDVAPKTSENFRQLCTGEKGMSLNSKEMLHYLGCRFFKCIKGERIICGDILKNDGSGPGESIYGPYFDDETHANRHSHAGVLAMNTEGDGRSNNSQFYITLRATPHLNRTGVVFGQVTSGMEIIRQISRIPCDINDCPKVPVVIVGCGQVGVPPPAHAGLAQGKRAVEARLALEAARRVAALKGLTSHQSADGEGSEEDDEDEQDGSLWRSVMAKRPKLGEQEGAVAGSGAAGVTAGANGEGEGNSDDDEEEEEDLLSLFGKRPTAPASDAAPPTAAPRAGMSMESRLRALDQQLNQARKLNSKETLTEMKATLAVDSGAGEGRVAAGKYNKVALAVARDAEKEIEGRLQIATGTTSSYRKADKEASLAQAVLGDTAEASSLQQAKRERKAQTAAFGWDVFNEASAVRAHEKRLVDSGLVGKAFDRAAYEQQKQALGEDFVQKMTRGELDKDALNNIHLGLAAGISQSQKDKAHAALQADADARQQSRDSFSRRRATLGNEGDVDFINKRNAKFNKKLERAFGDVTRETKQSLERGSAV